jgi:hypothetical protein
MIYDNTIMKNFDNDDDDDDNDNDEFSIRSISLHYYYYYKTQIERCDAAFTIRGQDKNC